MRATARPRPSVGVDEQMATRKAGAAPLAAYADFAHTGPGTLAGRYLRRFWQPVYRRRRAAAGPRAAAPHHERGLHPVSRRRRHAARRRAPLRAPRHAALDRLGRGRLRALLLPRLEVRRRRPVRRAARRGRQLPAKVRIASYPTEEYLGLIFAYLGEGDAAAVAALPRVRGSTACSRSTPTCAAATTSRTSRTRST